MFKKRYTLDVGPIIIATILQARQPQVSGEIPCATLAGMRGFAEYCGVSYPSLRVALTRLKKAGMIESYCDETGITRYRMPALTQLIADHTAGLVADCSVENKRSSGYTVAIFSFKRDDVKERHIVRKILGSFGFKKIAQNAYLNVRVDSAKIIEEMAKENIQHNIFLFDCDNVSDFMKEKIRKEMELDKWDRKLEEFYLELIEFLRFDELSDEEIYNRFYYAAGVFYTYFQEGKPAIVKDFFLNDSAFEKVSKLFNDTYAEYGMSIRNHYLKLNL